MSFGRRRATLLLTSIAAAISVLFASASPAGAHPICCGNYWVDSHVLYAYGPVWQGNVDAFWQTILWYDGYLDISGIDGEFGYGTRDATANWEWYSGAPHWDGTVDGSIWDFADDYVDDLGGGAYQYRGALGNLPLSSAGAGLWFLNPSDGTWHDTDHY